MAGSTDTFGITPHGGGRDWLQRVSVAEGNDELRRDFCSLALHFGRRRINTIAQALSVFQPRLRNHQIFL
jgi:hypothetical protein